MDIFDSKICPVTGLKLEVKDRWQLQSGEYSCKIGVIAESIVISEPRGKSILETTIMFLEAFDDIVRSYPNTKKFVIIDNYTYFNKATHEARRKYIQYLNNHINVGMMVYMGLSRTLYLSVNIGKMINYLHFPIKIRENYIESITTAIERINSLGYNPIDSLNEIKNEFKNEAKVYDEIYDKNLKDIIKNPIINAYVEIFNKYLVNIKWNDYEYEIPLIEGLDQNHPLNVLRESLGIVKSDVSELIRDFVKQENELIETQENLKQLNANLENLVKLRTTELLRVNKELEIAKEEAELANKGKAVFLASISHELKTPLNSIMSYSSMGVSRLDQISKDKIKSYFSQINSSGKRLLGLLVDLIDITKFEAGAMGFNFAINDIAYTIKTAISEILSLAERKKIEIILENNVKDVNFVFDGARILQVFINLLSNAVKFTPENKTISIFLSDNDQKFICSIEDEGIGLNEDEYEYIFNTFKRGTKSSHSSGTGLGLAISRNIITAHNGKIWAENSKNKGAVFTFFISKNIKRP